MWRKILMQKRKEIEPREKVENPVHIPEALIERLKPFGARFLKVAPPVIDDSKTGKNPIEDHWQDHPYEANDLELQDWLARGGNYGIVCGKGVVEVDLDDEDLCKKFEKAFDTFTVRTGGGWRHFFFRSSINDNATINKDGENVGNVQGHNKMVVGAGSRHHTGGTYEIIKDVPFAWVEKEELEKFFGDALAWTGQKRKEVQEWALKEEELAGVKIPIWEVVGNFEDLRQIGKGEFQGAHPIHGSKTGQNFTINLERNCWHCFRCNSGGGALSWLAVKHGLIKCHEAQKGVLRGEKFLKALQLAKDEGYDVEIEEREELSADVRKYFNAKGDFVPAFLADELMEDHRYITRQSDETVFVYLEDKGVYSRFGESHIKRRVKEKLGKHFRRYRQNEVISDIIASTLQAIPETPPHLIALRNGIFNVETGKLQDFSPDYFILNSLPVRYDKRIKPKKTLKFIKEIVHIDDVKVLQEIGGYCLYRHYSFHKAFMLVGEGANGKSTFLELLRAMLGNENVSNVPLQSLTRAFSRAQLYGKLANIYPDLSDRSLAQTGWFKMASGKDHVSGEYKYKNEFSFLNYAKLVFSANKVPKTTDETTAFFRRWIIVNFPNQFLDDNPKTDKHLIGKLTTEKELSGFLNWALEGLQRLLKQDKFSHGKSVEETYEQWTRASDPAKAFAIDCLEYQAGSVETKEDVYAAFISYCQEHKLPTVAKNAFSMKLPEHIPQISATRRRVGLEGKRETCWQDVALACPPSSARVSQKDSFSIVKNRESSSREVESKSFLKQAHFRDKADGDFAEKLWPEEKT